MRTEQPSTENRSRQTDRFATFTGSAWTRQCTWTGQIQKGAALPSHCLQAQRIADLALRWCRLEGHSGPKVSAGRLLQLEF